MRTRHYCLATLLVAGFDAQAAPPVVNQNYLQAPLAFDRQGENFTARGRGYAIGIKGGEATLGVANRTITLDFTGSRKTAAITGPQLPGKVNYIQGNDPRQWRTGLPTWGRITYPNVYPGIDVTYYGNQQQLEFDLIVKPGADPRAIRMKIGGAEKLALNAAGAVEIAKGLDIQLPKIYQEVNGTRRRISGHYALAKHDEIAFRVDAYDKTRPLVVDPTVVYSSYLGGAAGFAAGYAVALDSSHNIYVAGQTNDQAFPVVNATQPGYAGNNDGFVTKYNSFGNQILYSTYIGGSNNDILNSIAVTGSGFVWAAGYTNSTNFPLLGAAQAVYGGGANDAVLICLDRSGVPEFSTYLGGSGNDEALGVAVDSNANAYVTGFSNSTNFPTTGGVIQTANQGGNDIFVEKFTPGDSRIYATLLGGTGTDQGFGIAADGSGNAYVTGTTTSSAFNPANPAGGAQASFVNTNGVQDAFVAELNSNGTALLYFTYLGKGDEQSLAIALDSVNNATIAGNTGSPGLATAGAAQTVPGGGLDGFVASLNPTGSHLNYFTYLGGNRGDTVRAVALDGMANVYVTGNTDSTNLPTVSPLEAAIPGNTDTLFVSTNSGAAWSPLDSTISGAVFDVSPDPVTEGTIVASTQQGIFLTTNNGTSWTQELAGIFGALYLARSPVTSTTIYAIQGSGGARISADNGVTWTNPGQAGVSMSGIVADPLAAGTAYAFGSSGVYATTNSGTTWTKSNTGLPATNVVAMIATSDGSVYVVIPNNGIYKSTNQASSWTTIITIGQGFNPGPHSISASGTTIYAAPGGVPSSTIYVTTNGFTSVNAVPTSLTNAVQVTAAPGNANVIYAGNGDNTIQVSTDGGTTWSSAGTGLPFFRGNAFDIVVDPLNSAHVFAQNADNTTAFVGKLNSSGSAFTYLTYFGAAGAGSSNTVGSGIATDGQGNAYVAGSVTTDNFLITDDALQPLSNGPAAFLSQFSDSSAGCSYPVSPQTVIIPGSGANGNAEGGGIPIVESSACSWTASVTQSWVTPTGGTSGTGIGFVSANVAPNTTGASRSAALMINGNTWINFTQPDSSCTWSVDMNVYTAPASGGMVSPVLTTGASCPWEVTNYYPAGVTTSTPTGTGSQTLSFTVTANNGSISRDFYLPVGPQWNSTQVHITQAGLAPGFTTGPNYGTYPIGDIQIPLNASGGTPPYTFSVSSGALPNNLYIRPDGPSFFPAGTPAGIIGSTTATGTATFTLLVTDANLQTATQFGTIKVIGLNISDPSQMPNAYTNVAYVFTPTSTGATGTVTWSSPNTALLPPGITLNSGAISGTPTTPGAYNFTLTATDSTGSVSRGYNIQVFGPGFTNSGALGNATVGTAITPIQLNGQGGTAPYTFSAGASPGLSISSSGLISGTPVNINGTVTYRFSVTITDHAGLTSTKTFAINYLAANGTPSLPTMGYPNPLSDASVGSRQTFSLNANNGKQPYTWGITGSLPAGMSLVTSNLSPLNGNLADVDAAIAGVPLATGSFPVVITLTDSSPTPVTIQQPITINVKAMDNDFPPAFTRGTAANFYLRPIGGTGPFTWAMTGGALPAAMTFDASTGIISGTPFENGSFSAAFSITSSAASGSLQLNRQIGFTVNSTTSPTISANGTAPDGILNSPYSYTPNFCCATGTLSYAVTTGVLPTGLTINSATGNISGTPSASGLYAFAITATDSANAANFGVRTYSINISLLRVSTPNPTGNSGTFYTTTFTATGGNSPYSWAPAPGAQPPPGVTLSSAGVLSGTPTSPGAFHLNYVVTDSSGTPNLYHGSVTVNIYPAGENPPITFQNGANLGTFTTGTLQMSLGAAGGNGTFTWSLLSGTLPPGLALRADVPSGFSASQQAGLIGVATTEGTYTFTLQIASGNAPNVSQQFTMRITTLNVMDPNVPDAFQNNAYSYTFTPVGNAAAVSFTPTGGVPPGMTLSAAGVLSGTPTQFFDYTLTFTISDGTDTVSRSFNLNSYEVAIPTSGALPNGTQGSAYGPVQLTATGGQVVSNYGFTVNGNLPAGLTLSATGVFSAAAITAGPGLYSFSVTATNPMGGAYTKPFEILVLGTQPALARINWYKPDDLVVGNHTTLDFGACCGGTTPFTWSATNLPPGLALRQGAAASSNVPPNFAEVYGVPQTPGPYSFTITVTDFLNNTTSNIFTLNVGVIDVTPGLPNPTYGVPYTAPLRVVGGTTGAYSATFVDGELPAGLALVESPLEVTGTPTENYTCCNSPVFLFSDNNGHTLRRTEFITVSGGPSSTVVINSNGYDSYNLGTVGLGPYSTQFSACCTQSLAFSLAGGTLPPGLGLSPGGLLSGNLTTPGTYTFLLMAADPTLSDFGRRQFVLTVTPLSINSPGPTPGTLGAPYSYTFGATGAAGTVTWAVTQDTILPPGLSLNSATGAVTGTPTSAGPYQFAVQALDTPSGNVFVGNFVITITQTTVQPVAAFLDQNGAPALTFNGSTTFPDAGGFLTGAPAVAQAPNGDTYIVGLDGAGGVHLNSYSYSNQVWNGWQYSGGILDNGSLPGHVATGLSAAVAPNGAVWFTGRDIGNRYWINSWNGTSFGGWLLLDGAVQGVFAPDSVPQIAIPSDGSIYVIGKDIGERVWSTSYVPTTQTFTGFVDRQGVIVGQPSVAAGQDGMVYVAVRSVASESPVYITQIPANNGPNNPNVVSGSWWLNGGGQIDTDPQIASVGGTVYIAALADGGTVYLDTFVESTQTYGGYVFTGGILNDITIADQSGSVYVAGRDSGNRVYWYSQTGNSFFLAGNAGITVSTPLAGGK